MPLYIAKSGDLDRCYRCLTDSQMKDRATQLLIKYKSGSLVTQQVHTGLYPVEDIVHIRTHFTKLWSNAILTLEQESSPVAVNVSVH